MFDQMEVEKWKLSNQTHELSLLLSDVLRCLEKLWIYHIDGESSALCITRRGQVRSMCSHLSFARAAPSGDCGCVEAHPKYVEQVWIRLVRAHVIDPSWEECGKPSDLGGCDCYSCGGFGGTGNELRHRWERGGAFYGPKIDLKVNDAIGRTWQWGDGVDGRGKIDFSYQYTLYLLDYVSHNISSTCWSRIIK